MIALLALCLQERIELKDPAGYYLLEKPAAYTDRQSWPLIVDLRADEAPRKAGDTFVVAPRSSRDPDFVLSCLADVKARFRVDPRRVLLAGSGAEARRALEAGSRAPELFAGCALIGPADLPRVSRAPPCLLLLADRGDPRKPFALSLALKKAGVAIDVRGPLDPEAGFPAAREWFAKRTPPPPDFEALDALLHKGRMLDATLVCLDLLDRPGDERLARIRLQGIEGAALIALSKVETAVGDRKYLDAWLRCRDAAAQFAWVPTGARIRKRLEELESHPGVKKARESQD